MDLSAHHSSVTVTMLCAPEAVYDLVADVSRMGDWSPVCTGGRFDEADPTWFTGTNAIGGTTWETRCRIVVADRGREFAFINHGLEGRHEMVRWAFVMCGMPDGRTEVTQTWDVLPGYVDGFSEEQNPRMTLQQRLDLMKDLAERGMPETLANVKRHAETTA